MLQRCSMKASDDASGLLAKDELCAGMLQPCLRHELFHVQHLLECGHESKGVSDSARIAHAAWMAVDRVLLQFPVEAQARLEKSKSRLTQELISDTKSLRPIDAATRHRVGASHTAERRRARR